MGFNYGYKLNDNPKLTSLGEISFEPVTEEHRARVDREIAIFFTNKAREQVLTGFINLRLIMLEIGLLSKNYVQFCLSQYLIVEGHL